MATEEIRWIAKMLQAAVQAFGLSNRELEMRLGWQDGSLDDILKGRVELEPWHVVKILDGLSIEPAEPSEVDDLDLDDSGSFLVDELIGRFERLGYGPTEASVPDPPPPNGPELERRIRAVLREAFGEAAEGEEAAASDF
ncbi:MAG: hypothetical protein ACLGI9_10795 [Thermoanaerobaculia bacterium]